PRTKRELLQDLDTWERTQGGRAPVTNQGYGIMRKDFDGDGWANKNKVDFARLIADAKRKKATAAAAPDADKKEGGDSHAPESEQGGGLPQMASPSQAASNSADHGQAAVASELPAHSNGLGSHSAETPKSKGGYDASNTTLPHPNPPLAGLPDIPPPDVPHKESRDFHLNQQDVKEPCELPSHLATSSVRKVPMFSVPEEYSRDAGTGEGNGKG
ncbi:9963_t:CDS:1, partial [Scutellospora calospora]